MEREVIEINLVRWVGKKNENSGRENSISKDMKQKHVQEPGEVELGPVCGGKLCL